jgi:hypothetical protein
MNNPVSTILQFAEGLRYQVQFQDEQMLQALEREGVSFLRFARVCMNGRGQQEGRGTNQWAVPTRPSISDKKDG